eukprot:CAMPEP_0176063824 /NCGR_PEP_ID=MMETSP0120_2-20121206/31833_1 /TAXON_ID=160619 /ORGANISM="Kryptoperidinium foliaceum, Strain CCMP 1326" /LENGTH=659 /DNA_ID=CAMNT_0017397399 /DNA_START=53 /DNA_END=2032 /DNA_ORIENTATION=+
MTNAASPLAPEVAAAAAAGSASEGGVFFVSLQYKGSSYDVPVQGEDPIATIFDFAQEALDFPRETCKLIHRGKMLRPDHDELTVCAAGLQPGSKLMLVASSSRDVDFVRSSRADPLVKGFAEEERDEIARKKRARAAAVSAWGTKQDQEYRFNSIKAEFKYSEPPPFEAEKLLQRLATDPGIIDIMKSRRFQVGILTEMSPLEAQERMAKRGTPNMDLLGYNQNAGEMIVLRLRTDSLKGFRPYHDLINTLIHELTHNVWGPHDQNFWQLYGELKAQYMRFHKFWSHGGRAADSGATGQFGGFDGGDDGGDGGNGGGGGGGFGRALGGGEAISGSPRSRAAMAAAARAAMGTGPNEPPKPNFLAGNGQWIFVCPCGQIHDPAGCDVAQAAQVAQLATAAAAAAPKAPEVEAPDAAPPSAPVEEMRTAAPETAEDGEADAPMPPVVVTDSSPVSVPEPQTARAESHTESALPEAMSVLVASAAIEGSAVEPVSGPADGAQPLTSQLVVGDSSSSAAPMEVDAGSMEAHAGIDPTELEALGLDGAAVWLSNFSQRLRALRGVTVGGAAVELLLRMVRNVVSNPGEQKFRRIRADNPKIRSSLLSAGETGEALMRMLGFEATEDNGARVFVLRDASYDTARLHLGRELLEMELAAMSVASAK